MSAITTGAIAKLLWPGLNARWGVAYDEFPKEWPDLVDQNTSDMAYEEDQELTGFGLAPIKPQGQPIVYDTMQQGSTSRYTHVAYALGFIVTREAMEDNLYEKIGMQRTGSLAFSMRQTKENVVANLYNRAFNPVYAGGNGQPLLSTAHPLLSGGTYGNKAAIDADISEASLEDMSIQIAGAVNARGLRIAIKGETLIVPPTLFFEATRIMQSAGQSGTGNNDINAMKATGSFPGGIKVNHYLTDPDAWFIRTNVPDGLKLFQRIDPEFAQDNDFDTYNLKYKAYERYSTGWSDPRALYGSQGA